MEYPNTPGQLAIPGSAMTGLQPLYLLLRRQLAVMMGYVTVLHRCINLILHDEIYFSFFVFVYKKKNDWK